MPMNKFDEMMKCVVDKLTDLRDGAHVENSEDGVVEVLELAFHNGTPREKAKVVMLAVKYGWAACEEWYHAKEK